MVPKVVQWLCNRHHAERQRRANQLAKPCAKSVQMMVNGVRAVCWATRVEIVRPGASWRVTAAPGAALSVSCLSSSVDSARGGASGSDLSAASCASRSTLGRWGPSRDFAVLGGFLRILVGTCCGFWLVHYVKPWHCDEEGGSSRWPDSGLNPSDRTTRQSQLGRMHAVH
jgi:hypothetical protein